MECLHKLLTFGIPDALPIDENGDLCVDHHRRLLERRRYQERQKQAKKISDVWMASATTTTDDTLEISIPATCDVLLGRGKGYFTHVGNVRYRSIVEDHQEEYEKACKVGRQRIAGEVVDTVRGYGGRFLKDEKGVWVQIDNKAARYKVTHSFRALRANSNKKPKSDATNKPMDKEMKESVAPTMEPIRRD